MNGRNNISQFDVIRWLRFPMIVLVTYAHSYGHVAEGFNLLVSDWSTYDFLKLLVSQTLVKVAVPVFFIMSGYLFFANVEEWNMHVYKEKMLRRIKSLLLPYLVWNLMMVFKLKSFSWSIFWEPANMPLWFLRDLIIVSLFTPVIYIGVKRLGYWLLVALLPVYLSGIWLIQPGVNPYGICFFTLGAFMSIRKLELVDTCMRYKMPAYILSALFGLGMLMTYGTSMFPCLMLAFRLTGAIAVFCLGASFKVHKVPVPLCKSAQGDRNLVQSSAYFIYLAHYVFFFSFIDTTFFSLFDTSELSLCLHYLFCPLIKVIVLIFIYKIAYTAYTKYLSV